MFCDLSELMCVTGTFRVCEIFNGKVVYTAIT